MMRKFAILILISCGIAFAGIKPKDAPVKLCGGAQQFFMHPVWSPDASTIAFAGANYHGLWIIGADGSHLRQLSDEPAIGFGFSWSHDSKAIIARTARFDGFRRLNAVKLFDLEQNQAHLLTDFRSMMPSLPHWSEQGDKVFMIHRGRLEVLETGRTTTSLKKTSRNRRVLTIHDDQLTAVNLQNGDFEALAATENMRILNSVVSPDGRKVAFEVMGGNLHVINVDGTGLSDLGSGHRPSWAPGSQYLTYMVTVDDGHSYISSDIYVTKIDGSEKIQITDTPDLLEMNPHWSPDGSKIVFDTLTEGAIFILTVEKGN